MKTLSVFAPDYWASAIINLDYSGLAEDERGKLNTFLAEQGLSFTDCLDCRDAGFMRNHSASHLTGGATCCEYIFKEA